MSKKITDLTKEEIQEAIEDLIEKGIMARLPGGGYRLTMLGKDVARQLEKEDSEQWN